MPVRIRRLIRHLLRAGIVLAAALFLYWGGMLWGVLPGQPGVSWEGHLFGALGGLLAAWLVARVNSRRYSTGAAGTLAE